MLDLPDLTDPDAIDAWVTAVTGIPAEPPSVRWSGRETLWREEWQTTTDRLLEVSVPVPWPSGPDPATTAEAEALLARLEARSPVLAGLVWSYYWGGMSQRAIADREGVSQVLVHKRLRTARRMLEVLAHLPQWTAAEAADRIAAAGGRPQDRRVHALYWHVGQAGAVARVLGIGQRCAYRSVALVLRLPDPAVVVPWARLMRDWPASPVAR